MSPESNRHVSPDGQHEAELEPTGESFLGQALYRLVLDGIRMESKRSMFRWEFGDCLVWSSDSRWLAVQRWDLPDRGPQTSILVIDLQNRAWKVVGPASRSVMRPLKVEDDHLDIESLDVRSGAVKRWRTDLLGALERWGAYDDVNGPQ